MEDFTHKEFTIESLENETFRVADIDPVEMLAIYPQMDFENFTMTKVLYTFCLENSEVKVGEKWLPVKVRNKKIYSPIGIEKNIVALQDICNYMISEVIVKVFTNSNE